MFSSAQTLERPLSTLRRPLACEAHFLENGIIPPVDRGRRKLTQERVAKFASRVCHNAAISSKAHCVACAAVANQRNAVSILSPLAYELNVLNAVLLRLRATTNVLTLRTPHLRPRVATNCFPARIKSETKSAMHFSNYTETPATRPD